MNPQNFASARAHALLAELIELAADFPELVTAKALSEEHSLQVVLHLGPYKRTRILDADTGTPMLPKLHQAILDVLDRETPRKGEWIAAKLHRACSGSFRSALSELQGYGMIRKTEGGYVISGRQSASP